MSKTRDGFTLIELLVVITIIVVLLALLAPALDKAIYQAELAQCGASQRAVAGGAILYAFDYKRNYPLRPGNREDQDTTSWAPFTLAMGNQSNNPLNKRDLRPIIKEYIGPKLWQCPFTEELDLSEEATEGAGRVFSSYNMFFGFTYSRSTDWLGTGQFGTDASERGMIRLGDRWTFKPDANDPQGLVHSFNVLTTDIDWQKWTDEALGSHPDEAGTMGSVVFRNEPSPWPADGTWVGSWFQKGDTNETRGLIDMNASRDDGSVTRHTGVKAPTSEEQGFARVALMDTRFGWSGEWLSVPRN